MTLNPLSYITVYIKNAGEVVQTLELWYLNAGVLYFRQINSHIFHRSVLLTGKLTIINVQ